MHLGQLHRVLCWQTVCICFIRICICTISALAWFGLTVLQDSKPIYWVSLNSAWKCIVPQTCGNLRKSKDTRQMNEYSLRTHFKAWMLSKPLFSMTERQKFVFVCHCMVPAPNSTRLLLHLVSRGCLFSANSTPSPRLVVIATLCYNRDTSHTLSLVLACTLLSNITRYPINFGEIQINC